MAALLCHQRFEWQDALLSAFSLCFAPTSSVSPFLTLCSTAPVTSPLPRFTHNSCFLFWCGAFYHYFPLGVTAADMLTATDTSCQWMHNRIDCFCESWCHRRPRVQCCSWWPHLLCCSHRPAPVQLHPSASCPVICGAVWTLRVDLSCLHHLCPPPVSSFSMTDPAYRLEICHRTSVWRHVTHLVCWEQRPPWFLCDQCRRSSRCSAVWFCHGSLSLPEYFGVNIVLCSLN